MKQIKQRYLLQHYTANKNLLHLVAVLSVICEQTQI